MADVKLIKQLREMTQAGFLDCKKALEKNNDNLEAAVKELREKGLAKAAKKAGAIAAEGVIALVKNKNGSAILAEINSQTDFAAKNENFVKFVELVMEALANSDASTASAVKQLVLKSGETLENASNAITGKIGEKIGLRRFSRISLNKDQDIGIYLHNNKRYGAVVLFDKKADEEFKKHIAMHIVANNPKFVDSTQTDQKWLESEKAILLKNAESNEKFKGKPAAMIENIVGKQLEKRCAEVCLIDQPFDFEEGKKVGQVLKEKGLKVLSFVRYEVGEGIEKKESNFAEEVAQQMGK